MHVHRTCIGWHMLRESYADMNTHRDKHLDARRHMKVQHVRRTVLLPAASAYHQARIRFCIPHLVPLFQDTLHHQVEYRPRSLPGRPGRHETAHSVVSTHSRAKWFTSQVYTAWVTRSWERPLSWVLEPHP